MLYSEYFDIDEGYYPEINPNSIKDRANKWEKTFPHKTFIELLKAMERMLARGANADKKGIWIEGAYGTGKSRVAWTMKNLLDCSPEALTAYFDMYPELQGEKDLRDKLLGHKKERIITVSRYASGDIDSSRRLIMAVFDSVLRALKAAGLSYRGEATLRGKVASWLEDDVHKAMFNATIEKPQYRGWGSFSGKSADDIIALLRSSGESANALLDDILSLGENEGITAFSINMDELTDWLTDVIERNHLKAVVFVWDEFSSFFKNNKNSLDEFQKLAELSNHKPFYLMIVTHMSGAIAGEGDQSFNIVRDRFVRKEITLPDNIAFMLIRHVLRIKPAAQEQWEAHSDYLNGLMPTSRSAVAKAARVDEEVLTGLLPIHPMAALLLKNISTAFASNQRSMFNFIKNETEDLRAFQWYIERHSPDEGDILTIDALWDFFYEKGTDEHGNEVGRSNLDVLIRTILDTYTLNQDGLNEEEKTVLRTVLMMQAISQKLGDSFELFQPNARNLGYAFEGTDLENGRGYFIAKNQLVRKGILYERPGDMPTFAAAAVSGDQVAIDAIKRRLRDETRTAKLLADGGMESALSLTAALRLRYSIVPATSDDFTKTINRLSGEAPDYHIRGVICFARTEEDQKKLRGLIREAMADPRYAELVVIDAASNLMKADRFDQWVDAAANEEYWRPKDGHLADDMKNKAEAKLAEWKKDVVDGDFVLYPAVREQPAGRFGIQCAKMSRLMEELRGNVLSLYPLSFDNAKVSENFFNMNQLPAGAKNGINQTAGGIYQQGAIAAMLKGVWQIPGNYWETQPHLPISKLKRKVDAYLDAAFQRDVRVLVGDVFDMLMEEGFMPCNMYSLLTGFLLKEYIGDQYRYGIGISGDEGGKMTAEKLGDHIGEYIKHVNTPIKNYREKYIEIMTRNQKKFIEFAQEVFSTDENFSVELTVNKVRYKLKELGAPVWSYQKIDTNGLSPFLDKLGVMANSQKESLASLADAFGGMLSQVPSAAAQLKSILTPGNGRRALALFLREFEDGEIYALAEKIGIQDVCAEVKKQISSGEALWLWDQETGEGESRKLLVDYRIIAASMELKMTCASWYSCMEAWRTAARFIKIPQAVLALRRPELKRFFLALREIAETGDLAYDKRAGFLAELEDRRGGVSEILSGASQIFAAEYAMSLSEFAGQEKLEIYSRLPGSSFTDDPSDYAKNLDTQIHAAKRERNKFKLHRLWESRTDSKGPREWSEDHKTPILAMVPAGEQPLAKKLFTVLQARSPDEPEVLEALQYLESKAEFLEDLRDPDKVERAFRAAIIGKYGLLLKDSQEVRRVLLAAVPVDVYDWYANTGIQEQVKKMADTKYFAEGCDVAVRRFQSMPEERAKEYLIRLIKENPTVGIEILAEKGDEG